MNSAQTTEQSFEADLRSVFQTGSGVMSLTVIHATSAGAIITAAVEGDAAAQAILHAAARLLQ